MRAVVVAITLSAAVAHADPERAKVLATEAEDLVAKGDLVAAAAKYREAYKADPRPEHMCNSGVAYHKAKDLPRSHRYLNQCVTMGSSLDQAYRDNLKAVVESIQTKLVEGDFTPIDIALEPASAVVMIEGGVPYDEEIVGGGRIWVPFGTYQFIVRADGYVEQKREVKATAHEPQPLRVELEKAKTIVAPPQSVTVEGAPPSKVPPAIATGVTVALATVGIVFYVKARGHIEDAESPTIDRSEFEDLKSKAHDEQRIALGTGIAAAIGAGVSTWLWIRASKRPMVEVTPAPAPNGAGVSATIHF